MTTGATEQHDLRGFERSLPMALMRARENVMRRFRPSLHAHGVTEQQWRVLRALGASESPLTAGELAEQTLLLGPSLSRMLVSLVERGLITKGAQVDDARRSEIALTGRGRQLLHDVAPESEAVYQSIETELGPEAMATLYVLLDRVANLDALDRSDQRGKTG